MTQKRFFKLLTRAHRYLGLILGIQILIWFSSGFFMSFFDIENVRGEHIAQKAKFELAHEDVIPLSELPIEAVKSLELLSAVGKPIYKVTAEDTQFYDALDGAIWDGIDKAAALTAARRYYKGEASPHAIMKLQTAPIEYRGPLPVWQVTYDDKPKTRLYLDANTGELKAVRTRLWRVFDFMWMLHIMDYDGRDDINNWWLWLCSGAAALFALSGILLVAHRMVLKPKKRLNAMDS